MRRSLFILIGGLTLAFAGFASTYFLATSHSLERNSTPELAWLKQEFQLNDEQYTGVCKLYGEYHSQCLEMCRQIDERNAHLRQLLTATNTVTPEIEEALAETAQLRAQCQAAMLNHFYAVSQTMPPQQGQRYLAWMERETLVPSPMATHSVSP